MPEAITSDCAQDFTVTLSDFGKGSITLCSLIDGPCCGFTATQDGVVMGDILNFSCDNIGENIFLLDDGAGIVCEVTVTVEGDICLPMPAPIPTIGQWGLICLSLLLLIFGVNGVRQRSVDLT